MRLITVRVEKAPETHATLSVAPWEVPLLQMIHSSVVDVGHQDIERDYPDPASEFQRLSTRYGFDVEKSETPHVEALYGSGTLGVQRLAEAIAAEEKAELARKPKGKQPVGKPVPIES